MQESDFIRGLCEEHALSGQWIRGNVVDAIQAFYPVVRGHDMMVSMTEDIPQRPNQAQVEELIVNYTNLSAARVKELFAANALPTHTRLCCIL